MENPLLSIVVPSKNEETNIERCLDSICKNSFSIKNKEIILSDCASTDKTIELAKLCPVKIIQLKANWTHTASAARYIGTLFAKGEFIFFIDSDMTLEPGFLENAISFLNTRPDVAGVSGIGKEIYLKNNKAVGALDNLYRVPFKIAPALFLGGSGMYRKSALREADGFNPFLAAAEEYELAQRLRKKNYLLMSLPIPMVAHHTAEISEWQEFLRKKNSNLFFGIGQTLRITNPLQNVIQMLTYYKEFSLFLTCLAYLMIVVFLRQILLIFLPLIALWMYQIFKKKSVKTGSLSLLKWALLSVDIIRGACHKPKSPKNYPTDPIIIKNDISN